MRALLLCALCVAGPASAVDLHSTTLSNPTAYIPAQCYTRTEDKAGTAHNPCYTCHVRSRAPHYINDQDLQMEYAFPGPALKNPWTNLFVDRSVAVEAAASAPEEILAYVRRDNYFSEDGAITLARTLGGGLPGGWDADGDGVWGGFIPDSYFNFDDAGFDIGPDGPTGWRAFAYQPLPGAFWPTNGSTDDVLIRLPEPYRQAIDGAYSPGIYALNLAIVEALITRRDVAIAPTDEAALGADLDRDGALATAERVAFAFAPLKGETMRWVGAAGALPEDEAPLAAGLYPLGTEFLHTVRYLDPVEGGVALAARMKEVRYMRKTRWLTYFDREDGSLAEAKEREDFPDRIALFDGDAEYGVSNGTGWRLQGFIEDADGDLRPQSFEETVFCMGCHGGIGVNDDDTFAFPRKLDASAFQGGWSHWTQGTGLRGVSELVRADGQPEYAHYLRVNGAGDELRGNRALIARWIGEDGVLDPEDAALFRHDIAELLYPAQDRAIRLNAAYREIVREQSFIKGRDSTWTPQQNVHKAVEQGQETGVTEEQKPWYAYR